MLPSYLMLAAILFCIGLCGALTKRNAVIVLLIALFRLKGTVQADEFDEMRR
ncbi:hypothetical protein PATA110616_04855 [Paenibacillus tarimensis]